MGVTRGVDRLFGPLMVALLAGIVILVSGGSAAAASSTRGLADRAGLRIGTAAQSVHLDDPGYRKLIRRQVNTITFENEAKWEVIHPDRNRYDFSGADHLARWAQRHGMKMRGHTLIWQAQNPAWLEQLEPSRQEAIGILREHIFRVVGHFRHRFPGLVTQWDVVNEPIDNDGVRRQNLWQRWIGNDYIALAFRFARRAAGPGVELYLNDYFDDALMAAVEATGGEFDDYDPDPKTTPGAKGSLGCDEVTKCVAVEKLVKGLLEQRVPIDGVGFQAHMLGPDPADYRALTSWIRPLGLKWAITEADVPEPANPSQAALEQQAEAFATALRSCVDDPACGTFVTWGLSDRYTWWEGLSGGIFPNALPFDDDLNPRPAVAAMDQVLAGAPRARCQKKPSTTFKFRIARGARLTRAIARVNGVPARIARPVRGRVKVSLAGSEGADAPVRLTVRIRRSGGRQAALRQREVHLCRGRAT
jgi:endo-1,4-beta-xylanase